MGSSIQTHQQAQANYDRLARWYDVLAGSSERPYTERAVQRLGLRPGERVLEIGAGTGGALIPLASQVGSEGFVCGLDISMNMLGQAKHKLDRSRPPAHVALVEGDAIRLPVADGALDAIFASFTLELFAAAEMPAVLAECRRVLRPGGKLGVIAMVEPERPTWMLRVYKWAHRTWPRVIDCRPIPLQEIVEEAGYRVLETRVESMWGLPVATVIAARAS